MDDNDAMIPNDTHCRKDDNDTPSKKRGPGVARSLPEKRDRTTS
jgi:hypothetical protein